jgi:hypothetical protein
MSAQRKANLDLPASLEEGLANARLRQLNDALRTMGEGGRIMTTAGVQALGTLRVLQIICSVAVFDAFTPDNDPYGEHDCATLMDDGEAILWKIDYYDLSLTGHSPDPSDPEVTTRVLTIMLASEH